MFWQSVIDGLANLLNWRILLGMVGVSLICSLYPVITMLMMGKGESENRIRAGCLFMFLGGPLIQGAAVSGFVLLCLPAIIGDGGFMPSPVIGSLLWPVFKWGFLALLFVLALCFVPILGSVIAKTPGVPVFLQGIFMMKPITKNLYRALSDGERLPDSVFPTFWSNLGYLVIGLALCWVALLAFGIVADQIKRRTSPIDHFLDRYRSEPPAAVVLIGMLVGPLLGLVPLLMWGQYVRQSIIALN